MLTLACLGADGCDICATVNGIRRWIAAAQVERCGQFLLLQQYVGEIGTALEYYHSGLPDRQP
jgi:hypothetical protein